MRQSTSLAEHFRGFSAVNLNVATASVALEKSLQRFGAVEQSRFASFSDSLDYLLPLKSFTTRFLVLGLDAWSILVTDMRGENCYVDAYAISRATHCNGIGLFLLEERRELHLFEKGQHVREIQSLRDGDRWYYRERGPLQPFENQEEYVRKKKRDRLTVDSLQRYFLDYTGFQIPDWKKTGFASVLGVKRSTTALKVPVNEFETVNDL